LKEILFSAGITCGMLFAPLSAIVEDLDRASYVERKALELLITNEHLSLVSDAASLSDFIDERQKLYSFDSSRYSIYFNDSSLPAWLEPSAFKEISATRDLEISLLGALDGHARGGLAPLSISDAKLVENSMRDRAGKGITMSLFSGALSSTSSGIVGRFISTEYIRHHTSFLYADIITGFPGLQNFDVAGSRFPLLDYPVWRSILSSVDASQLAGPVTLRARDVRQYLDELLIIRSGAAHAMLVAAIQSLISQISSYDSSESGFAKWPIRGRLEARIKAAIASCSFADNRHHDHLTDDAIYSFLERIEALRSRTLEKGSYAAKASSGYHIPMEKQRYEGKDAEVNEKFVFISYVREDAAKVDNLCAYLRANGLPVWQDRTELVPGERWKTSIRRAITTNACAFIACFSGNYLAREHSYMNEELALAIEEIRKRPHDRGWFVPVRLDDVLVPDRDIGAGETLRDLQQLDIFVNWDSACETLAKVLKAMLSR
jgi:hypothetical protein